MTTGSGEAVPTARPHFQWQPRAMAVALVVTASLVGAATAAQAHDILLGTSPKAGTTIAVVPTQVVLTFAEPALSVGTEVIVSGPAGQVQTGAAVLVRNTVIEHLRAGSAAGRYTVLWRVTSTDGHPVSGRFFFTARSPSPGRATSTTSSAPTSSAATSSARLSEPLAPAAESGRSPVRWWIVAGGPLVVLLLVVLAIVRRPRTAPDDERDPAS